VRLLLILAAAAPCLIAENLVSGALLRRVEKRYNGARTLQVHFAETYTQRGRAARTESGVLYLLKPGRMRWEYTQPAGKLFVCDGKTFFLFSPSTGQVETMKARETDDMRAPLAFLLGRLHFEKDFQGFTSREERGGVWISAEPKSANLPYSKAGFLVMSDARIERVQVTGQDQSVLEFQFEGERLNPPLKPELFAPLE
jgi:outer membrane lipoprotein carrier protein